MGKKSNAKKQQKVHQNATQAEESSPANQEKVQIEMLCRVYVENFQPLTELREENRRLKRAIIPVRISTLVERYVKPTIYSETLDKIRDRLAGHPLFVSFSFSCNGNCNFSDHTDHVSAINVIVGTLKADKPGDQFIVNSVPNYSSIIKWYDGENETSNSEFFIKLFKDTLQILFPKDYDLRLKDILLLVTEAEMIDVGSVLISKMNLNTIHVTCLYSVITIFEKVVYKTYNKARRLVQLVYLYIHSYVIGDSARGHEPFGTLEEFKNDVGLPHPLPKKILLRNFIELSIYIHDNINLFEAYFHLHEDITSEMLLKAISDSDTHRELATIKVKFSPILAVKQVIQLPETPSLQQTITAIEELRSIMRKWPNDEQYNSKFLDDMFYSFTGYKTLHGYQRILATEDPEEQVTLARQLNINCSLERIKLFSYAPLTTGALHFPNFALLKQVSIRVPINYLSIYSLIYSFQEETKQDSKVMLETLKNRTLFYNYNAAFDATC